MQEQVTQNYRGLKTAVIVMGVLLVFGTAALIAGLINQARKISQVMDLPVASNAANAPNTVQLPPELAGHVAQMTQDGPRLSLLVERNGVQKVVVIDLASGAVKVVIEIGRAGTP